MQTIYLDISNKGVVPFVYAKQKDVGRKFVAVISDNGVPYKIPTSSTISVWYDGDSGEGNYSDIGNKSAVKIDGNKITVNLIQQMLVNPGRGNIGIVINDSDGNQIGLWNIPYCVEERPGEDSEEAKQFYDAFSQTTSKLSLVNARLEQLTAMRDTQGAISLDGQSEKYGYSIKSNGATAQVEISFPDFALSQGLRMEFNDFPAAFAPLTNVVLTDPSTGADLEIEPAAVGANYTKIILTYGHDEDIQDFVEFIGEYPLSSISVAELADMRIGADGKTYSTAGTAIREQLKNIHDNDVIFTYVWNGEGVEPTWSCNYTYDSVEKMLANCKMPTVRFFNPNANRGLDSRANLIQRLAHEDGIYRLHIYTSSSEFVFYNNGTEDVVTQTAIPKYEDAVFYTLQSKSDSEKLQARKNIGAAFSGEIEDLRIGLDGTLYESAGEAVREQFRKSDLQNVVFYFDPSDDTWYCNVPYGTFKNLYDEGNLRSVRIANEKEDYFCLVDKIELHWTESGNSYFDMYSAVGVFRFDHHGNIEKIGDPAAGGVILPLIVTLDAESGVASSVPKELKAHVEAGGDVYLNTGEILVPMESTNGDDMARFVQVDDDKAVICSWVIADDGSYEYTELPIHGKDAHIVTLEDIGGQLHASVISLDIYQWVADGDTVVLYDGENYCSLKNCDLYCACFCAVKNGKKIFYFVGQDDRTAKEEHPLIADSFESAVLYTEQKLTDEQKAQARANIRAVASVNGQTPDENGNVELTVADGYTPVRGTDYWTDADKAEIKAYVDEAILGGAW